MDKASTPLQATDGLLPGMVRILAPTDFSQLSRVAVDAAVMLLTGNPDARLTIVHVVEPLHLIGTAEFGLPPDIGLAHRVNLADKEMRRLHSDYETQMPVETRVLTGHPARTICELAEAEHFDLIVLCSHGHAGLTRMLIGSVAEQVVQDACCPVLVVKPRRDTDEQFVPERVNLKLERIVVGYDHRAGAVRALEMARRLATRGRGRITLVHALDLPDSRVALNLLSDTQSDDQRVREAVGELARARARHLPEAGEWEVKAEIGHPWDVLTECARKAASDLIVVGPHEHTRWGHSFIGSAAQRVVRLAPCAVLAVK